MTVDKALKPEAETAADLAFTLLGGKQPDAALVNGKVANGKMDVPAILLVPVAVTKDNVKDTIIKDGFWKASDVCTSAYAAACAAAGISASGTGGSTGGTVPSGKIAILLPETKTARYETQDLPNFKAKLKALGFDVDNNLIYSNANQDASAQQQQAEAALTNGAKVLVLDPVDSDAAAVIADAAKAKGVSVVSYDRLIKGSDAVNYYISFDNEQVGKLQGQSLLTALGSKAKPTIVMINGSPTDNNATLFKAGAHSVLDGKVTIAKEYDTPDWSPNKAQDEMQQALTALGNKVDGVYAANDGTAGGAIAAMKSAGVNPLPPVTGQDAELAAIQRILTGEQYMTVYKAIKPEAE